MVRGKKTSLAALATVLLLAAGVFFLRQPVLDWYKLRGYEPPREITSLADETTLRQDWRRLFFVNRPEIAEAETFNTHCRKNEFTIVLGCYISGQNGIYILDVTDERLEGIKQVTAAHEFLHAAYERLGRSERDRIDSLLTQTYVNLSGNTRVRETIEQYRRQDPSVVSNELHSILGTEVRDLPAELEDYYSRYFADRHKIVEYSELYEQAFIERRNAVRDYDAQLQILKDEIEAMTDDAEDAEAELRAMRDEMNKLRSSGQTSEYNAMVPGYNSRVNQYNRDIDRLQAKIFQYNDIVNKRNMLAAEEAELIDAIDSREVVPERQ